MRWALLLFAGLVFADPAPDVIDLFRQSADALSQQNASAFLDNFDTGMPGYSDLRNEIETLLESTEVGTSIEIISSDGDDRKQDLQIDWMLEIPDQKVRREIIKCRIERRGKKWKITALDPIAFFKY
jgi:hypothetical protein